MVTQIGKELAVSINSRTALQVLIVDDEEELRELYGLILAQEFDIKITEASSGSEAVERLNSGVKFDVIISDYNMPKGNGEMVFLKAQELKTPFLLITSDRIEDHPNFLGKELFIYIQKPFSEQNLNSGVGKLLAERRKYIQIPLGSLLRIGKLSCPIYFELSSNKLIKVFNVGDHFNQSAYDNWSGKQVTGLLVSKDDFQSLVGDFKSQLLNEVFFKTIEGNTGEAIKVSEQIFEVLTNAIKMLGISQDIVELANKNIELVTQIISVNTSFKDLLSLHSLKDVAGILARSHLTGIICNWVAHEIQFSYPRTGEILTLAAFFHDIGLDDQTIKNEHQFIEAIRLGSRMNKEQVEKVKVHIDVAVNLLTNYRGCPQDVIRVVSEHHELPDGSGYPKNLKADQIGELSAIFIVVHEFVEFFFDPRKKTVLKGAWAEVYSRFNYPRFSVIHSLIDKNLKN